MPKTLWPVLCQLVLASTNILTGTFLICLTKLPTAVQTSAHTETKCYSSSIYCNTPCRPRSKSRLIIIFMYTLVNTVVSTDIFSLLWSWQGLPEHKRQHVTSVQQILGYHKPQRIQSSVHFGKENCHRKFIENPFYNQIYWRLNKIKSNSGWEIW